MLLFIFGLVPILCGLAAYRFSKMSQKDAWEVFGYTWAAWAAGFLASWLR